MANADKQFSFINDIQLYMNNVQDIMLYVTLFFGDTQIRHRIKIV